MSAATEVRRLVYRLTADGVRRRMGDEVRAILDRLGLSGPFWRFG